MDIHYLDPKKRTRYCAVVTIHHKKSLSSYQLGAIHDKYTIPREVEFDFGDTGGTTKVYIYFKTNFSDEEIKARVQQAKELSQKVVEEINSLSERLEHVQNHTMKLLEEAFNSN